MDLELLRTFLEVNRHRHYGKAGENLNLTSAAIGSRIRLLEKQLGVKLFDRRYHDLQLTSEGHRLVRHADLLLSGWSKARQEVIFGGAQQQITVGASIRLWNVVMQEWFHSVRKTMRDLAIIIELNPAEVLTQRLLHGHLDVAFMLEPPQIDLLQIKEIAEAELIMVSSEPELSAKESLEGDYIMVDWGLAHALQHRRLYPDAPEPQVRVAQAKMALNYLLDVGGSAYLPGRMIVQELEQNRLFIVKDAYKIKRLAYATYPVRSNKIDLIDSMLELFDYSVHVS